MLPHAWKRGQKLISGEISQLKTRVKSLQKVHRALVEDTKNSGRICRRFGMGGNTEAWRATGVGVLGHACEMRILRHELGLYSS